MFYEYCGVLLFWECNREPEIEIQTAFRYNLSGW